ncbi:MAG: hypothetical protein ACPGUC_01980 [Gammaproteobacteria bacterium]
MDIKLAHLRERSTTGHWINFAIFDARSRSGTDTENNRLLAQLTHAARSSGLRVDQSALVFAQGNQARFFGDRSLVHFLSRNWVPQWTHTLNV